MGARTHRSTCSPLDPMRSCVVAFLFVVSVSARMEVPTAFTAKGGEVGGSFLNQRHMRRYTSAYASSSTYTSATPPRTSTPTSAPTAVPTSAPTAQPMTPTIVVQKTVFAITATEFAAPSMQLLLKNGYASELGMYDAKAKAWISPHKSSDITLALATRRAVTVVFTTKIADPSLAAAVKTKSSGLTAAKLTTAVAAVKAADPAAFSGVTAPQSTGVTAPVVTEPEVDPCAAPVVCAATGTTITSMWAAVVVGAVVLLRH